MVQLEEFVENILLLLSGMGALKLARRVMRIRMWLASFGILVKKLLRGKSSGGELGIIEEDGVELDREE